MLPSNRRSGRGMMGKCFGGWWKMEIALKLEERKGDCRRPASPAQADVLPARMMRRQA